MEELFNALLDISRLDAGVVQPCVTTIPLAMVFDRVRFEYAPEADLIQCHEDIDACSMFAITVPLGARGNYMLIESSLEAAGVFDLSGALVLVIDDEGAVQEGMAALLRKWQCEVLTAGSGREMLQKLVTVRRSPDLILSDFRLRAGENGIEVVEMLRNEFNTDIPALLVTADTAPDRLRDAEASGLPIPYKPLNPARLRTLIANLLREDVNAAGQHDVG